MDTLYKILLEYGWAGFLFAVLVVIFYKIVLLKIGTQISDVINSIFRSPKAVPPPDLKYHQFFANAQYYLVFEIPNLELVAGKPVREKVFKDLLHIMVTAIYDECYQMTELDMSTWSADKWTADISQRVNNINFTVMGKARKEGIPEVVLLKFSRWQNPTFEMIHDYVAMLGNSNIYSDHVTRTNTLFLIMNLLMVTTIADSEVSLGEINGEITGLEYKGGVIE